MPVLFRIYRHKKSGKRYTPVGIVQNASTGRKGETMILYRCVEQYARQQRYARNLEEWEDKFEEIVDGKIHG